MIRTRDKLGFGLVAMTLAACGAYAADDGAVDRSKLPTPADIVDKAPKAEWVEIAPDDLLVMDLPPAATPVGIKPRRVVIQLMPAPFSQGWIGNIKKLAAAHWWDGTAIVRVQDNYVTQWGDPDGEDKAKAKPLPKDLVTVSEENYVSARRQNTTPVGEKTQAAPLFDDLMLANDSYGKAAGFEKGWPFATDGHMIWPLHCYGAVGVGRNTSPDTGTGAELYTVIGQAPRQLDRNIAVVGRVISGMEWLSSLPRGTGALGFYETPQERTPITSVRLASELPATNRPRFEYMNTGSKSFADYAKRRANRHDSFYNVPAGGVDICNVPVPVRAVKGK